MMGKRDRAYECEKCKQFVEFCEYNFETDACFECEELIKEKAEALTEPEEKNNE